MKNNDSNFDDPVFNLFFHFIQMNENESNKHLFVNNLGETLNNQTLSGVTGTEQDFVFPQYE